MKRIGFLGMFCLMLMACQTNDVFQWNKQSDGYILRTGDVDLGMLNIPQVKGIDVLTNIDELDSTTFKITAQFTAKKAITGSMAFFRNDPDSADHIKAEAAPFIQKDTIETTGAGDTFGGCILHFVLEKGLKDLEISDLKEMLTFANAAASIITTRRGALRVMPEAEEVRTLAQG